MSKRLILQVGISLVVVLATIMGTGTAISAMQSEDNNTGTGLHITVLPAFTSRDISNSLSLSGIVSQQSGGGIGGGGSSGGTGGGGAGAYRTDGKTLLYDSITATGIIMANIEAKSYDGKASVNITYGAIAKDKDGNVLHYVQIQPLMDIPPLPKGSNVVGLPYEFTPTGATFNPDVIISFKYDSTKVPDGAKLQLVFWSGVEWIQLKDVAVDPSTGTISGKTSHFTPFAVIAKLKTEPIITTTHTPTSTTTPVVITTPVITATQEPIITPVETITTEIPEPTITEEWVTSTITPEPSVKQPHVKDNYTGLYIVGGAILLVLFIIIYPMIKGHKKHKENNININK